LEHGSPVGSHFSGSIRGADVDLAHLDHQCE